MDGFCSKKACLCAQKCFSPRGSVWRRASAQVFARIGCAHFLERFGKVPKFGLWEDLGATFWLGELFGVKNVADKNMFCGGMILWWGFRGIPPAQMNSMVPRTHMDRLLCPKPTLFNYFVGISSFPGKLQVAPGTSLYIPYSPLRG